MYGEADQLIVLLLADGRAEEIYNGPGATPWSAAGPMAKNGQRSISVRKLRALAQEVPLEKLLAIVRPIAVPTRSPNNGMHPTANSAALIQGSSLAALHARRVMPGVRQHLLD